MSVTGRYEWSGDCGMAVKTHKDLHVVSMSSPPTGNFALHILLESSICKLRIVAVDLESYVEC